MGLRPIGLGNLHYIVIGTVNLKYIAISGHFPDTISVSESVGYGLNRLHVMTHPD